MSFFFAKQENSKIDLPGGHWLLIKKRLTAGEERAMYGQMLKESGIGVDPTKVSDSKIVAYLLDWSVTDADDKPIVIYDQDESAVRSALSGMRKEAYKLIQREIEDHMARVEREDEEEKKMILGGEPESSKTSHSAESLVGATTG